MKKKIIASFTLLFLLLPMVALADGGSVTLINPIKCKDLLCVLIGAIRLFLGAVGVFALFVFIYGGFLMLSSAGNPEAIKKSKDTLVWATIGILVILGSWVFISYVLQSFAGVSGIEPAASEPESAINLTKLFIYDIIK